MKHNYDELTYVTKCKLEDDRIFVYDQATKSKENVTLNLDVFEYIGYGVIFTINNSPCNSDEKFHFWKYIE